MRRWLTPVLLCTAMATASAVNAQPSASGRVGVGVGVRYIGSMPIAEVAATETTAGGGSRTLFSTKTSLKGSIGGTLSVGVRVAPVLLVEAGAVVNPTHLSTRVSNDVEQANDTTATERVTQVIAEGGVLLTPWKRRSASRVRPFAIAGLGYVRHLNEGRTLVETGSEFYAGGGLYYERASSRASRLKSTGLRLDARAVVLRGAIAPDTGSHVAPAITAAVFARF